VLHVPAHHHHNKPLFVVLPALLLLPASAGLQPDAPDVPLTGWNSSSDAYSLAYVSEDEAAQNPPAGQAPAAAAPIKLLLKALVIGDSTLVVCLATDTPGAQPQTVELNLDEYVSSSSSSSQGGGDSGSSAAAAGQAGPLVAKTYKNLDQLAQQVNKALADITAAAVGSSGGSSGVKRKSPTSAEAGKQQGEAGSGANPGHQGSRPAQPQQPQQQEPDPDYDPLRIGPPRRPLRVGKFHPVCWDSGTVCGILAPAATKHWMAFARTLQDH
jgi:hypothetical protein